MMIMPIAPPRSIDVTKTAKHRKVSLRKRRPLSSSNPGEKITFIGFQKVRLEKAPPLSEKLNNIKTEKMTEHSADTAAITQHRINTPANMYPKIIIQLSQVVMGSLELPRRSSIS